MINPMYVTFLALEKRRKTDQQSEAYRRANLRWSERAATQGSKDKKRPDKSQKEDSRS